jgi:hypothetical protein
MIVQEFFSLSGEFEKRVKKMNLDPKYEQELIAMFNQASGEDPCGVCGSKGTCENYKWHKKYLNTEDAQKSDSCSSCGCCP